MLFRTDIPLSWRGRAQGGRRLGPGAPPLCCANERRLAAEIRRHVPMLDVKVLSAGVRLFEKGATVPALAVIERGLVALRYTTHGRQVVLMLLRTGDVLGDVQLITGNAAAFDAVTMAETRLVTLPAERFWELVEQSAEFARWWVGYTACRLGGYQDRLLSMLAGDVRAQVAMLLLHEFADADSTTLTQQMIADLLGVRRSSVSRAVRYLEQRGVIACGYAHLRLHDRAALVLAAQGYAPALADVSAA